MAKPRILIVPHAGYFLSGRVAGAGFAQVRDCTTVILLGVSHRSEFETVAVYLGDSWQTPLGTVPIDRDLVLDLVAACPIFRINNGVHKYEHTLEVRSVLEDFRIVPLLLGNHLAIRDASAALARVFNDQTLLVVSSDLSHYLSQTEAEMVDRPTIDAIMSLDPEQFEVVMFRQMRRGMTGLLTCACGASAVEVALRMAQHLRFDQAVLLAYANSGSVTGDSHRVVGYASIAFS